MPPPRVPPPKPRPQTSPLKPHGKISNGVDKKRKRGSTEKEKVVIDLASSEIDDSDDEPVVIKETSKAKKPISKVEVKVADWKGKGKGKAKLVLEDEGNHQEGMIILSFLSDHIYITNGLHFV